MSPSHIPRTKIERRTVTMADKRVTIVSLVALFQPSLHFSDHTVHTQSPKSLQQQQQLTPGNARRCGIDLRRDSNRATPPFKSRTPIENTTNKAVRDEGASLVDRRRSLSVAEVFFPASRPSHLASTFSGLGREGGSRYERLLASAKRHL